MVHAQKVTIDYSKEFDFDSVKTFQYVDTNESNPEDEMMADRVEKMIIAELKGGGLRTVEGDPDIYVTYHLAGQGGVTLDTTSYGYGGSWGGWGGDGGYTSTSSGGGKDPCYAPDCRCPNGLCKESCCEFAMLVVDAYDAKEKKIIWRGEGWVSIESKPNKQTKQIEKILKKLGKKWDIILAGKEK